MLCYSKTCQLSWADRCWNMFTLMTADLSLYLWLHNQKQKGSKGWKMAIYWELYFTLFNHESKSKAAPIMYKKYWLPSIMLQICFQWTWDSIAIQPNNIQCPLFYFFVKLKFFYYTIIFFSEWVAFSWIKCRQP